MTETHSTLQFAERAARIVNHVARVKVSSDDALMNKHMHDVEALRAVSRGNEDEESAALDKETCITSPYAGSRIGPGYCSSRSARGEAKGS